MIGFQELTRRQIYILSAALSAVLLIAMVATFRSCRPHTYPAELVAADSLCDSNADSAAVVLSRLERSGGYDGADRMYLDLLKVKLANNLYEPQKDSTIFRVVDYFEDMGDRKRLCQAYYYQGKYYMQHNDAPQALKSFQQALDNVDENSNFAFRSKVYNQSGNIFLSQDLYDDAMVMYAKSYSCDSILADTVDVINNLRDIAQIYRHQKKYAQCLKKLREAYILSDAINDQELKESLSVVMASCYLVSGRVADAKKVLFGNMTGTDRCLFSPSYGLAITIYEEEGKLDSVLYYSDKLMDCGTVYAKETASRKLVEYYSLAGDMGKVRHYLMLNRKYADSIQAMTVSETVAKVHSLYNYSLREKEISTMQLKNKETTIIFMLVTIMILSLVFVFVYLNEKNKKKCLEFERLHEHVANLYKTSLRSFQEQKTISENRIQKLESALDDAMLYKAKVDNLSNSKRLYIFDIIKKKVNNKKNVTSADWKNIEEAMDIAFPNFRNCLYSYYTLDEREYRVCVLIKLGLSISDIAMIMCRSNSALTLMRMSLYKKIFNESGSAKDFDKFIKSL